VLERLVEPLVLRGRLRRFLSMNGHWRKHGYGNRAQDQILGLPHVNPLVVL
jgi:hypothetical protein